MIIFMITIYYSDSCYFCKQLIEELTQNNINFELKDVNEPLFASELKAINSSGVVPTTLISNKNTLTVIVGADTNKVLDYLHFSSNDFNNHLKEGPKETLSVETASCPTDDRGNHLCSCYGLKYKEDRKCCVSNASCGGCFNGNKLSYCYI